MRAATLLLGLLLAGTAAAQTEALRDPTVWPPGLHAPAPMAAAAAGSADAVSWHILVSEGRAYVVTGGRRLGHGARFGMAEIVRIEDKAVWLRDATGTRREPLYPGVERRPATPDKLAEAPAALKKKTISASPQEKSK